MDDLIRYSYLRGGCSVAGCGQEGCTWTDRSHTPKIVAARARKHARGTGHAVRVNDTRVTVYRPRGQA